jgi:beta-glucosidase
MYYPPFAGAVAAGVGSIMCSYNLINGKWACENPTTLGDLKAGMGFKGYVMSDWGATHSTSIMAGLDIEMPSAKFMNPKNIRAGLAAGNITEAAVSDSVYRILLSMYAVGVMDEPESAWDWGKLQTNCTTAASVSSARKLSALSTVLLKNEGGILPLATSGQTVAVIGFGDTGAVVHGGGSGSVVASFTATPLAGVKAATSGKVTFADGTDLAAASALAHAADVAIIFVGTLSHEGGDRLSLSLDDGCDVNTKPGQANPQCTGNNHNQTQMIERIAAANPNTVVVMSIPGAVLTPWAGSVKAILTNFMPGECALFVS